MGSKVSDPAVDVSRLKVVDCNPSNRLGCHRMTITPKLLSRGLEVFAGLSLAGFIGFLYFTSNVGAFFSTMLSLEWGWVLAGVALASLDWFGGGLRIWVLLRQLRPDPPLKGSILAGGMAAWGGILTPSQTGGGPLMIYTLRRHGVPVHESVIIALMTFIATIIFYAVTGPFALLMGAGRALEERSVLGQSMTLYDLFMLSLGGFVTIGIGVIVLVMFPGIATKLASWLARWLRARGRDSLADRVRKAEQGIEQSHECLVTFFSSWSGWAALGGSVIMSAFAFANRLLAGFVVLRMLGIHANFVDVLLLQTLITFLLYFAPTPGGSGIAELLSYAVMGIYIEDKLLLPAYIFLWRFVTSYLTLAVGSAVFWLWLKGASQKGDLLSQPEIPVVSG